MHHPERKKVLPMVSRKLTKSIAIAASAIVIGGGAYSIVSATASTGAGTTTPASSTSAASGQRALGGGGSNARSGPAAGGASGTVDSVSKSSFTILTSAGQKVTVNKASSTKYAEGDELDLGERHRERRKRPRAWDDQRNDHHGHAGHGATDWRRASATSSRQRWSPSSAAHRPRQSRSGRSRRTTNRGRGRSSAERSE